jgi:hypothetical protein
LSFGPPLPLSNRAQCSLQNVSPAATSQRQAALPQLRRASFIIFT